MSHDVTDFETEVIERSRTRPVLVDFWAEWCGPCRVLGPVLERLEAESEGAWELAKVDVDRNQALAARFGIRGIPAVKLFRDGVAVAEFTGAVPEGEVRRWLQANLSGEGPAAPGGGGDPVLAQARQRAAAGDVPGAVELLETRISQDPEQADARLLLAQLLLLHDPVRARELVGDLKGEPEQQELASAVGTLAELLARAPDSWPPGPAREALLAGLEALRGQEIETAMERLLEALAGGKGYEDGAARRALTALFRLLGRDHPLTRRYQRRFQSLLH